MSVELIDFDAALFLKNEDDIADYLTDLLADGNAALTQHALGVAVRAAGMMKICGKTGLTRQGIAKATRASSKPSFQTVLSIVQGLGLEVQFVQQHRAA